MLLELWLQKKFMKQSTFSKMNGMSTSQVQRYVRENDIPRPIPMLKIFKATDEEVTPNDFYGIVFTNPNNEQLCISCRKGIVKRHCITSQTRLYEDYKIKK